MQQCHIELVTELKGRTSTLPYDRNHEEDPSIQISRSRSKLQGELVTKVPGVLFLAR